MSQEFEAELRDRHFLSPPWNLPGDGDAELLGYLQAEDFGSATTLLQDVVAACPDEPRFLLLLAHCRFRDAMEVMLDERLAASQDALRWIDQALSLGMPMEWVAPFRNEVERVLAEETAAELKLLAMLPEDGDYSKLETETLLEAAYRLWDAEPRRAGELFLCAAQRPEGTINERLRAGLCFHQAHEAERARPLLEEGLSFDWAGEGLWNDRRMTESAFTALLQEAAQRGDRPQFERLWEQAVQRGEALELPFPSVWPHQDALLKSCLELMALDQALQVARRIEEDRGRLSRQLAEHLRQVRLLAGGQLS